MAATSPSAGSFAGPSESSSPSSGRARTSSPTGNLSSTYLLSRSNLTDEQKLQVALCRRQCWIRGAQFGGLSVLGGYAGCIILGALAPRALPRGAKTAVPLVAGVVGLCVGSYYGGMEARPFMVDALRQPR